MGKLHEDKKKHILHLYFEELMAPEEIAEKMGLSMRTVTGVLSDRKLLEPFKRRSEAAKLRAQICVNETAEEAVRKQAELMRAQETAHSVTQRAAMDILDRAGVRVPKEEKKDIRITFAAGMPKIGMPKRGGETQ
ncbi:MAG: hypothetical protein E7321_03450 [Clostridiales bacterium]|nr:hypothetical protein [Clostridiales bacterium]